jgi:N-methylhydantoinase A
MDLGIRLAADVGGTFTDVAAFDETTGELRLGKALTTPTRLVTGVEAAVTRAGAQFSCVRLSFTVRPSPSTPFWSALERRARC